MVIPTTPEAASPSAHLIVPTEEQMASKEAMVERVDSTSSEPTVVKKFGFGAGMRMYAKSLAQIEHGDEAVSTEPTDDIKEDVKVPVAEEALSGEAPREEAVVEQRTPSAIVNDAAATTDAAGVVEESRDDAEPTAVVTATPTPDTVVELLSEDDESNKVAAKSAVPSITLPSCGSVYQHITDSISFFFRKAEESLDDAHETVCARDVSCAADVHNEILETEADRMKEAATPLSNDNKTEEVVAVVEDAPQDEAAAATAESQE